MTRVTEWLGLRSDALAIEAMRHPERSAYARFGPRNARYGNDIFFLADPAMQPKRGRVYTLAAGTELQISPQVKELAEVFGYE